METKIEKIDGYELGSFIKKLLPIDKFIFIKIGQPGTVSSVYFPERDAVKLVSVNTADIFSGDYDKPIKVSFYNGQKVVEALSHFNGNIQGRIKYSELDGEYMASDFILENSDLKINLACADPSLSFMELSKEEMSRAFGTDNSMFEFDLLTTHVDRIKSLFNLDKEEETFTLYLSDKGVSVKGTSYDSTVTASHTGDAPLGSKVVIYKKYLNLLDKENYKAIICENKVVFKSLDTNTHLTVAVAMIDED
jgi:hypothetical protein